jgi:hypothetical protein
VCSVGGHKCSKVAGFNTKLQTHLKIHHPNMWKEFLGEGTDLFRNVYLKPMNADRSYFYFTFRSVDDLGDKQVHDYKRHVRAGIFGFLIYAVAQWLVFLMIGILLSLSRQ